MDRTEKLSIEQKIIDRTKKLSIDIFVAKTRNYNIFVAKIYDYALIDSFWRFPRFIDSPTSYATLFTILYKYQIAIWYEIWEFASPLLSVDSILALLGTKPITWSNNRKSYKSKENNWNVK